MARSSRLLYTPVTTTKSVVEVGPKLITGIIAVNDAATNTTLRLFDQDDVAAPGNDIGRFAVGGDQAIHIPFPEPLEIQLGLVVIGSAALDVTFIVRA